MTRVLVTGATGFLGGWTCAKLVSEGFTVTGTGRQPEIGESLSKNLGVGFIQSDLTTRAFLQHEGDYDHVVHCAALSSPWGRRDDFMEANVLGTQRVIELCVERGIRSLVHISTPSLYIDGEHQHDVKENQPLATPINHYAETKLQAERVIGRANSEGSLDAIILRPQGIIGPGDTAIAPRLLRLAERGWLPLIGGGKALLDLTPVQSVAEAIALALPRTEELRGRVYNIANGERLSIKEIVSLFCAKTGLNPRLLRVPFSVAARLGRALERVSHISGSWEPPLTTYSAIAMGRSRTLNIDAARVDLGFAPSISVEDAIADYAKWREDGYGFAPGS